MAKCKRCGAEINFIRMKSGKYMPVDPEPVAYKEGVGGGIVITPEGERIRGGEPFGYEAADGYGYIPHCATCPYVGRVREAELNWEAPPQTLEEIVESVKSSAEKLERSLRRHAPEYMVLTSWADYHPIRKAFDAGELPKCIKDVLQVKELAPGHAVISKYIPPLESMEFRYDPN